MKKEKLSEICGFGSVPGRYILSKIHRGGPVMAAMRWKTRARLVYNHCMCRFHGRVFCTQNFDPMK